MQYSRQRTAGFSFIELIIVVLIVGVLSAILLPRYWEVARQARIATLDGVVGAMRSTVGIARTNALANGIRPAAARPSGGDSQPDYVIQMEGFRAEVDWRNLCPESQAENGDAVSMLDYLQLADTAWETTSPLTDGKLHTGFDNRFTWVGYDIRLSEPGGCYVRYDSFGTPSCTIELTIDDC